jgi:hypothetical protein
MKHVVITGFDRITDELVSENVVPPGIVNIAREIANVPAGDPDIIGAYPLTERQVRAIADAAAITITPGPLEYFLEAWVVDR